MRQIIILCVILLVNGCVSIPDSDNAFLDHQIYIGSSERSSIIKTEARGFYEVAVKQATKRVFDDKTKKFEPQPVGFKETVQHNLGFNRIVGSPDGHLRCFHRKYWHIVASGVRIICWTSDTSGQLTWRQAGWNGASL